MNEKSRLHVSENRENRFFFSDKNHNETRVHGANAAIPFFGDKPVP
jgi:hypothetical protein